jgi:flagellar biosynthetic protein FliR
MAMTPDLAFALLVLARIAGMVFSAPVLSERALPWPVKAGLALSLAALFEPLVARPAALPLEFMPLLAAVAGELAVGLVIGFAAAVVFAAAKGAGRLIEQQVGLSPAVEDRDEGETSWVGLTGLLVAVVFFAMNGHHALFAGTLRSFEAIPVMGAVPRGDAGLRLVGQLGATLFATSLMLSGPVILTLLLVTLATGVLVRAVPELDNRSTLLGARSAVGLVAACVGLGAVLSGFARVAMPAPERVFEFLGGRP